MTKIGLAYCVTQPIAEALARTPGANDQDTMDDFLKFCANGVRPDNDPTRNAILAPGTQRPMTGVINWLAAEGVTTANFYIARKPTMMFFASVTATSNAAADWKDIPGFMLFVKTGDLTLKLGEGEFRTDNEFILEPIPDLDKALSDMRPFLDNVSVKNKHKLVIALRGNKDTDLNETLNKIEAEENLGLLAHLNQRLTMF